MVMITLISYLVITIESSVIDVAKDFTALTIIADFDNYFGAFGSGQELPKLICTEKKYRWLFTIETTTSKDAEREKDADIGEDWVFKEIETRRNKEIKNHERIISATGSKPKLRRPTSISLSQERRNCDNFFLYTVYKLFRIFHVSIWFYPTPFIVLISMYAYAFMRSLKQLDPDCDDDPIDA